MSSDRESPSQHPTDRLIRRLIATGTPASEDEIQSIVDRMASAPFNADEQNVPPRLRITYLGRTLDRREDSLSIHLVKRVLDEGQWAVGTTAADYLRDIRAAVRDPSAHLFVSQPAWGDAIVATISTTESVIAPERRGPNAEPLLFVAYSAADAKIVTAYMFSSLATLRLSGDTVWLK